MLVQADATVLSIARNGGAYVQLPKDASLPMWTYRVISNVSGYTLARGLPGLSMNRMQIDCYARTGAEVINLAEAIDNVLSGFSGTLSDPDTTKIDSCFQSDVMDFFDDASRSYRRMLEYQVWFFRN